MVTPIILELNDLGDYSSDGTKAVPKDHATVARDFAIPSLPSAVVPDNTHSTTGWAALKNEGRWFAVECYFNHGIGFVHTRPKNKKIYDCMALPIDPRMKREDIDGAVDVFLNADNTGWLFGHAGVGHHHDHEINLMAGIDAVMQPMFRQYTVDFITGKNAQAKRRASGLYSLLSIFYGEVLGLARTNARAKHLGERHKDTHPDTGPLHTEIKAAFDAIKMKWEVDRRADATKLGTAFTYITNALVIPTPETRWDKAARLEAEAKAKKAKEAAEAAESASDSSSDGGSGS